MGCFNSGTGQLSCPSPGWEQEESLFQKKSGALPRGQMNVELERLAMFPCLFRVFKMSVFYF